MDREVEVPVPVEPVANAPADPPPEPVPEPETEPPAPENDPVPIEPLDGVTEGWLVEGSTAFIEKRYADAAEWFRKAVARNPGRAEPKFALGQALLGAGEWDDAANVLRAALVQEPDVLKAPGSIVSVYESPEEFFLVLSRLKSDLLRHPRDPNRLFLLVYQYIFSEDPAAIPWCGRLARAAPDDAALELLEASLPERFPEFATHARIR